VTATVPRSAASSPAPGRFAHAVVVVAAGIGASLVAWAGALAGAKGTLGIAGIVGFAALMIVTPRRHETLLAVSVLSFAALMHKSFTGLAEISSGPPSIYVSSFDIVVGLLYFAWFVSDPRQMRLDLTSAFSKPVMYVPGIAALLMAPGVLVAGDTKLAGAEVVRMAVMYAVFVYFAVRIRTRTDVRIVIGGLMSVAVIEALIVAGQYVTKSSLGLSLFGTPTILHNRFDGIAVARPFGTMAHPVFMAAVLGPLALMAFCLAVNVRRQRDRWIFIGLSAVAVSPLVLASARSASLAIVVAFVILVPIMLVTGRLSAVAAGWWTLAALTAAVITSPYLISFWNKSFKTEHFGTEWESRAELNTLAIKMFEDRPFFGHGLNNFEQVMGQYDDFGLIFADNPVHNVYLLQLAETGVIGFLGMVLFGVVILCRAVRLARVRDRLYSAIGFGVAASMLFWAVEEYLVFSLRQDHPRSLLFIMSGLVVSVSEIAGADHRPMRPRRVIAPGSSEPSPSRPRQLVGFNAAPLVFALLASGSVAAVVSSDVAPASLVSLDACGQPTVDSIVAADGEVAINGFAPAASNWLDSASADSATPSSSTELQNTSTPTNEAPPSSVVVPPTISPDEGTEQASTAVATTIAPTESTSPAPLDATINPSSSTTTTVETATTSTVAPVRGDDEVVILRADTVPSGPTSHEAKLSIVTASVDRKTGRRGIYVASPCSNDVVKVSPNDDRDYSWATWANGGTKILFTARSGPPGVNEPIYWMDRDGSNVELLLDTGQRLGQPKMSSDGRTIVFGAVVAGSVATNLIKWDLATGALTNLSAVSGGRLDSDPRFTPDGQSIVFIDSYSQETNSVGPGEVTIMDINGQQRRAVTDDNLFDTDPDVGPAGDVVSSRFLGDGQPSASDPDNPFQVTLEDFVLVRRDLDTGSETTLTNGEPCYRLTPTLACLPVEGSSYLPLHTPDGQRVGFVTQLNSARTCVCTIGTDRSDSRALLSSSELALSWFDWIELTTAPPTAVLDPVRPSPPPPAVERTENVLVSYVDGTGPHLRTTAPGDTTPTVIDLPDDYDVHQASWNAQRDTIVFSARVDPASFPDRPVPPPPAGEERTEHFTLNDLDAVSAQTPAAEDASVQLFLANTDGSNVRQLTSPWTEDWRDGHRSGDGHANATADLSPSGRYVLYTSSSTRSSESSIMRFDLTTGEVLSLTNATSGAIQTRDRDASWSSTGGEVAFVSNSGGAWDVWLMNEDGGNARPVTSSDAVERFPTWAPDNQRLAYLSSGTNGVTDVVVYDLSSGQSRRLSAGPGSTPVRVSWSPDGDHVAIVHATAGGFFELAYVDVASGAVVESSQTPGANETWVDWG
jgi:Tol biopolymer transport system component